MSHNNNNHGCQATSDRARGADPATWCITANVFLYVGITQAIILTVLGHQSGSDTAPHTGPGICITGVVFSSLY